MDRERAARRAACAEDSGPAGEDMIRRTAAAMPPASSGFKAIASEPRTRRTSHPSSACATIGLALASIGPSLLGMT